MQIYAGLKSRIFSSSFLESQGQMSDVRATAGSAEYLKHLRIDVDEILSIFIRFSEGQVRRPILQVNQILQNVMDEFWWNIDCMYILG